MGFGQSSFFDPLVVLFGDIFDLLESCESGPIFREAPMSVALLHLFQVCFRLPRHVDVLQRDRERRLTWNMQLFARCNVIAVKVFFICRRI